MTDSMKNVKTIFGKALEIHSNDERAKYLDQACAGDESLHNEVNDLLGAIEKAGNFLGGSSPNVATIDHSSPNRLATPLALTSSESKSAKGAWAWSTSPSRPSRFSAKWP